MKNRKKTMKQAKSTARASKATLKEVRLMQTKYTPGTAEGDLETVEQDLKIQQKREDRHDPRVSDNR